MKEHDPESLHIRWSPHYHPAWDTTPEEYVAGGIVAWGRSRRLAKAEDSAVAFTAYLGVQHYDPARWHVAAEPRAKFFVSLFVNRRTVALRTYPTLAEALDELHRFHAALRTTG